MKATNIEESNVSNLQPANSFNVFDDQPHQNFGMLHFLNKVGSIQSLRQKRDSSPFTGSQRLQSANQVPRRTQLAGPLNYGLGHEPT